MTDDERFDSFISNCRRAVAIFTAPALSVTEVVGMLAIMAFKPPWWINVPLIFAWLIWRNNRDRLTE